VAYQSLGVVTTGGGPLRVELGNDADGYVIADAVRVVPAAQASVALAGADLLRDVGGPEGVPLNREEMLQVASEGAQAPLIAAVRSVTRPVSDRVVLNCGRQALALALGMTRSSVASTTPTVGARAIRPAASGPASSPLILPVAEQEPGRPHRIGRTRRVLSGLGS
jgi:hypothetical protein